MTVVPSNYARKENDLYQTEPWATEALIRNFPIAGMTVWEPSAGNHLMADVLREHCETVVTSDIETYDRPHDFIANFLEYPMHLKGAPTPCQAIITNPPYGPHNRDAVRYAEFALRRCEGMVALLLTAKFDFGKSRMHLFRKNSRFAAKIALVDRIQWFPGDSTGTEDHAWFIWLASSGPPICLYEGREAIEEEKQGRLF